MAYQGILGPDQATGSELEAGPDSLGLLQNQQPGGSNYAIKQINLENDKIVKDLQKWYDKDISSSLRIDFLKRAQEYHLAYQGWMPPTSFPWENCSNVDLGIVEMVVDNIKARFKMSTIGGKPAFAAVPLSVGAEQVKNDVQEMMSSALDQQVDIEKVADCISQDTVELGNCVVKRRWLKEPKTVKAFKEEVVPVRFRTPFLNMFSQNMSNFILEEQEVVEEKACVEVVSLENILVPENAPEDVQRMHHIMHLYNLCESDLDELYGSDTSYDQEAITKAKEHLQKMGPDKENPKRSKKIQQEDPEPKLKCAEVYCKWKVDNKWVEVVINWVIGTDLVLRKVRLIDLYFDGLRPFRWFRYKSSGNVYGRGVVEMMYPYRTALNSIFNMSVNCMFLQIMPWGFYKYGSSFKPDDHKVSPGTWIPLDDIQDARVMQFPPTSRMADGAIQLLISLVERQSGISAPQLGQASGSRTTAFEVKAVLSEGNIKHEERIDYFKDTFGDLLKDIFNLYKFNNPDNAIFRKLYDERGGLLKSPMFFKPASRMILSQYDFDFIILGTLTTGNKAIERQDAIQFAEWMLRLPIVAENPDALNELARDVGYTFGKRDLEKYLPPKQVTQALKQMKLQELVQMAQGQREPTGQKTPPRQRV